MKRIIHILSSNRFAGAESVVCSIIENNDISNGIEMYYCSPKGSIEQTLKRKKIKYIPINKLSIWEIKKVIRNYKPDIIHAHDYTASVICGFCCKKASLVSHLHHNALWTRKWNLRSFIYTSMIKKYKYIIGVSEEVFQTAIYKRLIKEKMIILHNPIDVEKIKKEAMQCVNEKYDLCYIGRFAKEKNPEEFIYIIDALKNVMPKIKGVMIGTGEMVGECKEIIKSRGLSNNIALLGFQENPYKYLKNSRILISTSKWEGYGLVVAEAITLDKPVIARNSGGVSSILGVNSSYIYNLLEEGVGKIINMLSDEGEYEKALYYVKKYKENIIDKNTYMDRLKEIYINV